MQNSCSAAFLALKWYNGVLNVNWKMEKASGLTTIIH